MCNVLKCTQNSFILVSCLLTYSYVKCEECHSVPPGTIFRGGTRYLLVVPYRVYSERAEMGDRRSSLQNIGIKDNAAGIQSV